MHDVRLLRRIVDEAFCSRSAMSALELLGDLAFEGGDFAAAQQWWRLLTGLGTSSAKNGKDRLLFYPDATAEVLARVRAKQILTLLFQEQSYRVPAELQTYRKLYGAAAGSLGGRKGAYADIVEALWKERHGMLPPDELEWPTFAGDPSRNRALAVAPSPRLWAEGPAWRVRLDSGERLPDSDLVKLPATKTAARQLAFFPVIAAGVAGVADARFVRGYHLRTGRLVFQYDLFKSRKFSGAEEINLKLPAAAGLCYSLTAADGHFFARLGAQWLGPPKNGGSQEADSWLVCLEPGEIGAPAAKLERWAVAAPRKDGEQIAFEGAPLVHQQAVYIAQSRLKGSRTLTSICCFDADTGNLRWEQDVSEASEFADDAAPRGRHHLLTLAGTSIVYCSHAGAVVAVDALSGKRVWAVRYPSQGPKTREGQPSPRDLCPAMAAGSHVLVAPADLDRLWCLEAATGRSLWEREGLQIVHLLGVSHDRVVFTTPAGLRAVHAGTGNDDGGWSQPGLGTLGSQGRGLIADGWVFWPTQDAQLPWRALNIVDGALVRGVEAHEPGLLRSLQTGNVAFGNGCLIIAAGEELLAYVPPQPPVAPPRT
jgi:outer membrane protein assembly factor BamB